MSGHSHYDTIKRQKATNDAKRGQIFSKMAREIILAVKTGGNDPEINYKLRIAIERAKSVNMPKASIERAVNSGEKGGALNEVTYEGFGPSGIAVVVKVATDNRNRTSQEIKNLFERVGGNLAGPGAVSFNFENKGFIFLEKTNNSQDQILKLIDLGVEDVEETNDGIEVFVAPEQLREFREKLEKGGFKIKETELFMKPKNYHTIEDADAVKKALGFLETLDDHDDVQKVFSNIDIPDS